MQVQHDLATFEARLKDVHTSLAGLATATDFEELIKIIHRPGWTTVAELAFATGILEAMHAHAQVMVGLKQALLRGSDQVRGTSQ
jgi:hypothetical protein